MLGIASNHVFHSWGKKQLVGGTVANIAQNLRKNAWRRLSAGEGIKSLPTAALTQTRWGSKRANQSGLKKIELGASVHLALDELELGNLSFEVVPVV